MSGDDVFRNWLAEVDVWVRELHRHPIREVPAAMVDMSRSSNKPKDKEALGLIFKKLSKRRNGALVKCDTYDVVTKKRISGLLEINSAQSKGIILTNVERKLLS